METCVKIPHESLIFLLAPFGGGKSERANQLDVLDKIFLCENHPANVLCEGSEQHLLQTHVQAALQ